MKYKVHVINNVINYNICIMSSHFINLVKGIGDFICYPNDSVS